MSRQFHADLFRILITCCALTAPAQAGTCESILKSSNRIYEEVNHENKIGGGRGILLVSWNGGEWDKCEYGNFLMDGGYPVSFTQIKCGSRIFRDPLSGVFDKNGQEFSTTIRLPDSPVKTINEACRVESGYYIQKKTMIFEGGVIGTSIGLSARLTQFDAYRVITPNF